MLTEGWWRLTVRTTSLPLHLFIAVVTASGWLKTADENGRNSLHHRRRLPDTFSSIRLTARPGIWWWCSAVSIHRSTICWRPDLTATNGFLDNEWTSFLLELFQLGMKFRRRFWNLSFLADSNWLAISKLVTPMRRFDWSSPPNSI